MTSLPSLSVLSLNPSEDVGAPQLTVPEIKAFEMEQSDRRKNLVQTDAIMKGLMAQYAESEKEYSVSLSKIFDKDQFELLYLQLLDIQAKQMRHYRHLEECHKLFFPLYEQAYLEQAYREQVYGYTANRNVMQDHYQFLISVKQTEIERLKAYESALTQRTYIFNILLLVGIPDDPETRIKVDKIGNDMTTGRSWRLLRRHTAKNEKEWLISQSAALNKLRYEESTRFNLREQEYKLTLATLTAAEPKRGRGQAEEENEKKKQKALE
tara:strand:- start:316 stop:1116 length:801 start_codon:yes stop_codon:yes gene_type:complete